MTWNQIFDRIKRLEQLTAGLGKEDTVISKEAYPLHFSERNDYLEGVGKLVRESEMARTALVRAKHRGEAAAKPRSTP
jgi:hypothetical protein